MEDKTWTVHVFKVLGEVLTGVFTPLILIVWSVLGATVYIVVSRSDHDWICYSALLGSAATVGFACKCYNYVLKEKDLILRTDECYTSNIHKNNGKTEQIGRPGASKRAGKSKKSKEK